MAMIDKVRNALRISVADNAAINEELTDLIEAAKLDLGIAGVVVPQTVDPIVTKAIITYCKLSFGLPEDYDRLKRSYDRSEEHTSELQSRI